ncbi:hypothetical protein [Methylovulum psychrotolerans]|uniref:Uncharacterized protein n=1 Tax=Methylovulum psychrotolerans TaxID=1704499 RepID=A0A2S5CR69_9GAMM|nr:hypothetical protein [Methylovulum psychrotolerans]POZ53303.1 hypothetical protein AADEFJLK_00322 [Methylovulum psychrotolerans]
MAVCTEFNYVVDQNGLADINQEFLAVSAKSLEDCTGFVLLSAQEYSSLPTLTDIFAMPLESDLQQMFMTGFGLPMIAYLVSWAYGTLINWFKPSYDETLGD